MDTGQPLSSSLVRKISWQVLAYSLVLSLVTLGVTFFFFFQFQMQQVNSWIVTFPNSVLPHLVESDYFSIAGKARLLETTGLFDYLRVEDPKGGTIVELPEHSDRDARGWFTQTLTIELADLSGFVWGRFSYRVSAKQMLRSFLSVTALALLGIILLFFALRRRLLREIVVRESKLVEYTTELERKRYLDELSKSAAQVSHDIQSPLAALKMLLPTFRQLSEESRTLLREAIARIEYIAFTLEAKLRNQEARNDVVTEEHFLSLVGWLLREKRAEWTGANRITLTEQLTENDLWRAFVSVNRGEFNRLLSNLLNNAEEACRVSGAEAKIHVSAVRVESGLTLSIRDNGPGIPAEILSSLGQRGVTYGKAKGSGLGLYHAKQKVEGWGGDLSITSQVGQGTEVSVWLPEVKSPSWFPLEIVGTRSAEWVIVDDDPMIHQVWERKFAQAMSEGEPLVRRHFTRVEEFSSWLEARGQARCVALFDFELSSERANGLELLGQLSGKDRRYLITNHYAEASLRNECERMGIMLLPKAMAEYAPLRFISEGE